MSLCRLLRPLLLKLYFNEPRKSLKNTFLCVYTTFNPIPACTHSILSNTRAHRETCIKTKTFGVFLNESRITWRLAFHMPGKHSDSTLHCLLEGYILSLLDALKEENFGEKGNYSPLLPHLFMLESASLCPFGAHIVALPKLVIAL